MINALRYDGTTSIKVKHTQLMIRLTQITLTVLLPSRIISSILGASSLLLIMCF